MSETAAIKEALSEPLPSKSVLGSWKSVGFWTSLVVAIPSLVLVFAGFGLPIDWWTWIGVCFGLLPAIIAWCRRSDSLGYAAITLLYFLSFVFPLERDYLQDLHGGRHGYQILPHCFRFGKTGQNTGLLEEALGPLDAEWMESHLQFMLLSKWRDGNERLNSRNLIFSQDLPAILKRLPDEKAQRQVLGCLTDSTNFLRFHQCILLAGIKDLGYPTGMNAQTWWDKHAWVFKRETDPAAAIGIVFGWRDKLPQRFGRYQLMLAAESLAHSSPMAEELERLFEGGISLDDPRLGVNRIVWWSN